MDADEIASLSNELDAFLGLFDDCFCRSDVRSSLGVYVRGQLSDLPAKSCEPIALAAGTRPRCLREPGHAACNSFSQPTSGIMTGCGRNWPSWWLLNELVVAERAGGC